LRALKQTGARVFFKYQLFKHSLPKNMTVVDTDFLDEIVADYKPSHYKMAKSRKMTLLKFYILLEQRECQKVSC